VRRLSDRHHVRVLCEAGGVSRSGYYKYLRSRTEVPEEDLDLVERIRRVQGQVMQTYGYRRMKLALESEYAIPVNKKRIARLQREHQLQARIRRRRSSAPPLIFAVPEGPKPNILDRDFHAAGPDRKWVTDITTVQVGSQRLYVSAVMDLFNREIVSYSINASIALPLVLQSIQDAFEIRRLDRVLVHSDQGGHYTSTTYCSLLRSHNAIQSMSRKGNCWDNASMECFFGQFKSELINRLKTCSRQELENSIHAYVRFYNTRRIQTKIKMAPVVYRSHFVQTT
jgi:putative transposase